MKKITSVVALIAVWIILAGCGIQAEETSGDDSASFETESAQTENVQDVSPFIEQTISIYDIPAYSGNAYTVINDNIPYFADKELLTESFEYYSDLDSLGRSGVCVASIGQDIMPTEGRGEIENIKPTGWHTVKYPDIVEDNYLFNRCHLIGFQLSGENTNENNLITGTRYLNVEGMLPFENMVADFVKETGYHVMYRVTPVFSGDNLVADGVLIEAESVEDNGNGIMFNVFCYNVQPGISIDYATGDSVEEERIIQEEQSVPIPESEPASESTPTRESATLESEPVSESASVPESVATSESESASESTPAPEQTQETPSSAEPESQAPADISSGSGAYAVNSNNGKIHIVGACPATGNGKNAMKHPVYFDTYEEAEAYSVQIAPSQKKRPCGNCW